MNVPYKMVGSFRITDIAAIYARKKKNMWPLKDMQVGDIIDVEKGQYGRSSPRSYPHTYGQRTGKRFSSVHIGGAVFRITRLE